MLGIWIRFEWSLEQNYGTQSISRRQELNSEHKKQIEKQKRDW